MKFLFVAIILFISSSFSLAISKSNQRMLDDWQKFKQQYNKVYNSRSHELYRQNIWLENMKYITRHNDEADMGKHTFRLAMNEFGDLKAKEFAKKITKLNIKAEPKVKKQESVPQNLNIPSSVDWRNKGCVGGVREQSSTCNDIWAFGVTETIAGMSCAINGKYVPLSAQQLIDCSDSYGNYGCEGGFFDNSCKYIIDNKGIDSDACYPFKAMDDVCRFNSSCVAAVITGYQDVISGNETDLTLAIANRGPISCGIDASQTSFQFYISGIYYDPSCSSTQLDHLLLVVGYGSSNNNDYYIGKNSWGASWGQNGYILMSRNRNNNCGIASYATYVLF